MPLLQRIKQAVREGLNARDFVGFLMIFSNDLAVFSTAGVLLLSSSGGAFTQEQVYGNIFPSIGLLIFAGCIYFAIDAWRRTNATSIRATALPFGLNLPDVINFSIMMNNIAFVDGTDTAWKVGCSANFFNSVLLVIVGFGLLIRRCVRSSVSGEDVQRLINAVLPRVAQAATLAGIAFSLISGYNFFDGFSNPILTLWPLLAILVIALQIKRLEYGKAGQPASMTMRSIPVKYPGVTVLLVVVLASVVANIAKVAGLPNANVQDSTLLPSPWRFGVPQPMWFLGAAELRLTFGYLGVWLPLAIAGLVGAINNVSTALPKNNQPDLIWTLIVSGGLSLVSAFLGCPFPCTVYIGQPTFYATGAGYGYSVYNGICMAALTGFGLLPYIGYIVPNSALTPILVLIGVDITTEAFRAAVADTQRARFLTFTPALSNRDSISTERRALLGSKTDLREESALAVTPSNTATSETEIDIERERPKPMLEENDGDSSAVLFPSVVIGLLPSLASFAWQQVESLARKYHLSLSQVVSQFQALVYVQQGYILVAMLWSAVLYHITVAVEPIIARSYRRLKGDIYALLKASVLLGVLSMLSLFGLIHTVSIDANESLNPAFIGSDGWSPVGLYFFGVYLFCSVVALGAFFFVRKIGRV